MSVREAHYLKLLSHILLITLLGNSMSVLADTDEEHSYIAAFSLQVVNFIDFPSNYEQANVCFAGVDSFKVATSAKQHVQLKNLSLKVKVISEASVQQLLPQKCHIVYVAPLTIIDKPLIQTLGESALVIGNSDDFKSFGNSAAIVFENTRPQVSISKQQLKRSKFEVKSRLLNAVTVVP